MNGTFVGIAGSFMELQNAMTLEPSTFSNPSIELLDVFGGRETLAGERVTVMKALSIPALYRATGLIADVVANLPLLVKQVEDDGGMPLAKQHAAYRILKRKANPYISASIFRQTLTTHAQIRGNGYAFIQRDQRATPIDLTILDPAATFPVKWIPKGANRPEVWYATSIDGEMLRVPASDVLHIRNRSLDGLIGIPVVDLMREALGMEMAVRGFGAKFFGQGANYGGVLMIPGNIKQEAQKNLLDYWAETAVGSKSSHRIAMLQDGAKFERTTFAPEESQFLETKRFGLIDIANITNVPPHKIGDNSRQAYNSIEAENRSALDESYGPWLKRWEEECECKLLTEQEQENESHVVRFDRSGMLQPTINELATAHRAYREMGVLTINDILRQLGQETIGPEGDVRNIPANWLTLGASLDGSVTQAALALLMDAIKNSSKTQAA